MSILSKLQVVCPFPQVFEEIEDPEAIVPIYRWKIGHIRADHDGYRWWNTAWPCHKELATLKICQEMDQVYDALTAKDAFADLSVLRSYCSRFPKARANASRDDEYNFYYEGSSCLFWLRCITRQGDYNLYLHGFLKADREETEITEAP